MSPVRVFLLAPFLLVACTTSGSGSASSSGSNGGGNTAAVTNGYRQVLYALCAYNERCRATHGALHSDVEACQAAQDKELVVNSETYAAQARHYSVDATALTACVASLSTASCADRVPAELLGCQDALAPIIPAEVGEPCSVLDVEDTPRCAEGATHWCNVAAAGCGVCAARKANGGDCRINDECLSGFCNNTGLFPPNKCETVPGAKGAGEGCLDTLECRGALVCAGGFLQKTCQPRALAGETCSPERNGAEPACVQDLMCVGGACGVLRADGAACARNPAMAGQAGCAGQCVLPSASAEAGTCQPLTALPGDGAPCSYVVVGEGAVIPQCAPGLFTDDRPGPACTCRVPLPAGTACLEDQACASRACDGETATQPGTCRALTADNASCMADADCMSGYCAQAGNARTCQARPQCG